MSTNFYLISDFPGAETQAVVHIGKFSSGWQFGFQEVFGCKSWKSLRKTISEKLEEGWYIRPEFGGRVTLEELDNYIQQADFYPRNMVTWLADDDIVPCFIKELYYLDEDGYCFCKGQFS